MPLAYAYSDKYLAPLVTTTTETTAVEDVALEGSFSPTHTEKLVILRAYVLTCQDSQRTPDDVFAAKLATYRKEYGETLTRARIAAAAAAAAAGDGGSAGSVFSIELFRG